MTSYNMMLGHMKSDVSKDEIIEENIDLDKSRDEPDYEEILMYSLASKDDLKLTPNK